jgi:hypothetical protein
LGKPIFCRRSVINHPIRASLARVWYGIGAGDSQKFRSIRIKLGRLAEEPLGTAIIAALLLCQGSLSKI